MTFAYTGLGLWLRWRSSIYQVSRTPFANSTQSISGLIKNFSIFPYPSSGGDCIGSHYNLNFYLEDKKEIHVKLLS